MGPITARFERPGSDLIAVSPCRIDEEPVEADASKLVDVSAHRLGTQALETQIPKRNISEFGDDEESDDKH